ncbi:MAG: hypothetical protein ABEJ26_07635 [Halosimplex sp.]
MDLRASSTAFDAVVFVLLVGVAVATVAGVPPRGEPGGDRVAEETADVLATSTTQVTHTRSVSVETTGLLAGERTQTVSVTRTVRGTYAAVLAAAAVADPRLGGGRLFGTGSELRAASRGVTERVLHTREANAQVAVAWRPYPNASLSSSFGVGDPPPRDVDVSATTVTVPSGFRNASARALRAARTRGFAGVASAVARGVVDGWFPRPATLTAFYSEGPDRALVANRYRRAADALSVAVVPPLRRRDVEAADRRLADALARRLEPELRRRYDSPEAAARAVSVRQVRLVVRTWSR